MECSTWKWPTLHDSDCSKLSGQQCLEAQPWMKRFMLSWDPGIHLHLGVCLRQKLSKLNYEANPTTPLALVSGIFPATRASMRIHSSEVKRPSTRGHNKTKSICLYAAMRLNLARVHAAMSPTFYSLSAAHACIAHHLSPINEATHSINLGYTCIAYASFEQHIS